MRDLLQNKYFWIVVAFFVPFVVIWVAASLLHAIVAYAVFGGMFILFKTQMGQRRTRRTGGDVNIYLGERPEGGVEDRVRKPKKDNKWIRTEREAQRRIRRWRP